MANEVDGATPLIIMIAMPTRGQVELPTVRSLIALTQEFQHHGLPFAFETYGAANLVINRNHLMSKFLAHKQFSHMLMLDSDMEFTPAAVWRLVAFGGDFVSASYPQKYYNWDLLRQRIAADTALPEAERSAMTMAGRRRCGRRRWNWCARATPTSARRWRPRRWPSVTASCSAPRRCASG